MDKILDEVLVIRGERNLSEDILRGMEMYPSGITGISVECAIDVPLEVLAKNIPHGQIGCTTVGKIRQLGGDVIRTSGRSPYHATLTGLIPNQICSLLTPTIPNPKSK